ncbi:MAG: DUF1287 domain-containing protein [Candidatus Cloacimonadota bacterium]|nr:MAG: DUF1287 domain-containing protein [Candidatus Cloacimonadota bacterium]
MKIFVKLLVFFILCEISTFATSFGQKVSNAALERLKSDVTYDGKYLKLKYPNGDVPKNIGVCTDVIIRTYRSLGIDLQKEVHEDMKDNFKLYPKNWGLKRTDTNIDHRRVPNLQTFFTRKGESLKVTKKQKNYKAGDIVTWSIEGLPHIGIVTHKKSWWNKNPLILHNVGKGPQLMDFLFVFPITGHYRYTKKL